MGDDVWVYLGLGMAALAAAAVNSIAGGGTLLTFPALLAVVTPVVANATSTVALVPGSLSAAWGYRREMRGLRRWLLLLTPPSLVGGLVGACLVTQLDPAYFDALVPWLILSAATLFLLQPVLARPARRRERPHAVTVVSVVFFQFLVAVYGGYFGAGIGILMLSALGLMGFKDIHAMNGLKNFLAACINGISVAEFIRAGIVDWRLAAFMAPIAIVGAYVGARLAQRVDRRWVRASVVVIGFALAAYFLYRRWT
jgi:uncharacterized membrane protein YfcA